MPTDRIVYRKSSCCEGATEVAGLKEMWKSVLYLRGSRHPIDIGRPKSVPVDRIIFDDCCFQNDPCDRCKDNYTG